MLVARKQGTSAHHNNVIQDFARLVFATLFNTLRVPLTAGSTSSFWASFGSLKNGDAVWNT